MRGREHPVDAQEGLSPVCHLLTLHCGGAPCARLRGVPGGGVDTRKQYFSRNPLGREPRGGEAAGVGVGGSGGILHGGKPASTVG